MDSNGSQHGSTPFAPPAPERGLTGRAVLLALVVGVLGSLVANYHDGVILHIDLAQHNVVAPLALAMLFVFALLLNSLLARLSPRRAFSGAELGVALALAVLATPLSRALAANWTRTIGYTNSLIDSQNAAAALVKANVFDVLPERALLGPEASRAFDDGVSPQIGRMARPGNIPWRDWLRPALYWAPFLFAFLALGISLAHLLYRQWAERELVPFPLAELAADLVRRASHRPFPDIFYVRSFWYGFGALVLVFGINGLHAHMPKTIEIPVKFQFYELAQQFPFLKNSLEGYSLLRGWIFFAVVAAAVLLPSEISFTSWFTWPLMVCCTYFYYAQTGQKFTGVENTMIMTGSFWAMALVILYAGRTHYAALFRRAFGRGARAGEAGGVDAHSIRVCRFFLLSVAGFAALLVLYGIPLDLAVIWTLALLMLFLVTCRIVAEMGIPWTPLSSVGPMPFLLSVLGEKALGAKAYAMLAIVDNLTLNTTVYIPSAAVSAAHIEARSSGGRLSGARVLIPFLAVMLTACAATAIWIGYSSEGAANDYPNRGFDTIATAAATIQNLYLRGDTPPAMRDLLAKNVPFRERWTSVRVDPRLPPLFAFGAALILVTSFARLRFAWFPLHPLPLVLLGTWVMSRYYFSFFLGWLIKAAILKIGGGRLFEKTKPFFVGVVTGLAFVYTAWILANIAIFRHNNFTFETDWNLIFRDIFSN
ncbi:MAG: DUF6785 family protein [Kiritimatiellia bacterium]